MDTTYLLLNGKTVAEVVATFYQSSKKTNPKYSLLYIARQAGLPSKNYLSDVMHGRRKLSKKYVSGIGKLFGLTDIELEYFRVMVDRDLSRSRKARSSLTARVDFLRKSIEACRYSMPAENGETLLAFEVFCSIDGFTSPPEFSDIRSRFPRVDIHKLDKSLKILVREGLIELKNACYRPAKDLVIFKSSKDKMHLNFLRDCLRDAEARVEHWFEKPDTAHFQSMILNVDPGKMKEFLPRFKAKMRELQMELGSEKGSSLMHFNIQIYPTMNNHLS